MKQRAADENKNHRNWEITLIGIGVFFYLFQFSHGIHGDGRARYDGMRHLLNTGEFLPIVYSFVGPLVSSPLILLGKIFKDEHWWLSRFNAFVFLLTVFWFSRSFAYEWPKNSKRLLILLLFAASMYPKHTTDYYSEVFSTCTMVATIIVWSERRFALGVLLLCLSVWNTPGTLIGTSLVGLYFAIKEKRLRYMLCLALLPAGIMLETYLKFGVFSPSSYIQTSGAQTILPYSALPGFSYPLFFGMLSVIFSFGKGLLFFVPGLVGIFHSGLWKLKEKEKDFFIAGLLYLLGLMLVFSRWWSWHGDWFWGPRFFLFASFLAPVMLALMHQRLILSTPWRVFWVLAVALSIWVSAQGVLFGQDFLEDCYRGNKFDLMFACHYVPEFSVLWRPFIVLPSLLGRRAAYVAFFLLVMVTILYRPVKELVLQFFHKLRGFGSSLKTGWRF